MKIDILGLPEALTQHPRHLISVKVKIYSFEVRTKLIYCSLSIHKTLQIDVHSNNEEAPC